MSRLAGVRVVAKKLGNSALIELYYYTNRMHSRGLWTALDNRGGV